MLKSCWPIHFQIILPTFQKWYYNVPSTSICFYQRGEYRIHYEHIHKKGSYQRNQNWKLIAFTVRFVESRQWTMNESRSNKKCIFFRKTVEKVSEEKCKFYRLQIAAVVLHVFFSPLVFAIVMYCNCIYILLKTDFLLSFFSISILKYDKTCKSLMYIFGMTN